MKVIKAAKGAASRMVGDGGFARPDESTALTERLSADLPEMSAVDISRHESWHRLRGLHLAKKRAEREVNLKMSVAQFFALAARSERGTKATGTSTCVSESQPQETANVIRTLKGSYICVASATTQPL